MEMVMSMMVVVTMIEIIVIILILFFFIITIVITSSLPQLYMEHQFNSFIVHKLFIKFCLYFPLLLFSSQQTPLLTRR